MKKFTCELCGEVLSTYRGRFKKHIEEIHNLNFEDYLREYHKELGGYCSVCGKPTGLMNLNKGFHHFCSSKCGNIGSKEKRKETVRKKYGVDYPGQSPEIQEKMKQTCLEKYGVENPNQLLEIKEKKKQTCLEKYGVEAPLKSLEIQEKMKKTNIERYGVEHTFQSLELKEKMKKTMIKRYGVENAAQSPEIQEKMKNTCLEKYGVENVFQSKEFQEKIKKINLEKYGVENPAQSLEIQEKMKKTMIKRYGVENPAQSPEIQEKMKYASIHYWFSLHEEICKRLDIIILESPEEWYHKEFKLEIKNHKFHCKVHNLDFETEFYYDRNLCPKCLTAHYSRGEREIGDYIESLGIPIIRNDRTMIKPKEIDIWIPSKNIAIEYNGSYWHQDQSKDQEKKLLCESKGISLYTVWDTDWENNKEEVMENIRKLFVS